MVDQMELLSGEIPAVPGIPTNSNDTQVQQRKTAKSDDFPWFLFYMYFLCGMYVWSATTYVILRSRFPTFSPQNLSPTCPEYDSKNPPKNIYEQNFSFDLHVIISENGNDGKLIWKKSKLIYGDLESAFNFNTNISISERVRNNGCLHLYACLTKSGFSPGPKKGDSWAELYTYCKTKRLSICREANGASFSSYQVRSYWRPNWTVNLVGEGFVSFPGKEDGRVDCDPLTSKFYPLLYLNDNFNLARDCIPIDQTTEWLPLESLVLVSSQLGQEFYDQLPVAAHFLIELNLREDSDELQLNFEFISQLPRLSRLRIDRSSLTFESLCSLAKGLAQLREASFRFQWREKKFSIKKYKELNEWQVFDYVPETGLRGQAVLKTEHPKEVLHLLEKLPDSTTEKEIMKSKN